MSEQDTQVPPRPKDLTPEGALAAAAEIVGDLKKAGLFADMDEAEAIADLVKHGREWSNGYELAKSLDDRCGWDIDAGFVEVLDNFGFVASRQIELAEKAWVTRYAIQPPLADGAAVTFRWQAGTTTGVIDGVYDGGTAKYRIRRDGDPVPNRHHIVNFEDVQPVVVGVDLATS